MSDHSMLEPPEPEEVKEHNVDDEQGDADEVSEAEVEQAADNDEQVAAGGRKRTRSATSTLKAPKAKKAKVEAPPKKLGKWTHDEDVTLLAAIKAYVIANKGQLPSVIRTTSAATCPPSWKSIASKVAKVATLTAEAGGKACSNRWSILRANCKVRQTDEVTNRKRLPTRTLTHSCSLQSHAEAITQHFLELLTTAYTTEAEAKLNAEVTGEARKQALDSMVKKKLDETKKHFSTVTNTTYAIMQWSPDHVRTEAEEQAWVKT